MTSKVNVMVMICQVNVMMCYAVLLCDASCYVSLVCTMSYVYIYIYIYHVTICHIVICTGML